MALDTTQDYVTAARILLQDQTAPYRYPDADLLNALNMSMLEARKLRPDLFMNVTIPTFSAVDTTKVPVDPLYRVPFVYYLVGMAQLRDDENDTDQRAAAFIAQFTSKLMALG